MPDYEILEDLGTTANLSKLNGGLKTFRELPKFSYNPFTKDFKYTKKYYLDKLEDNISVSIEDHSITNRELEGSEIVLAKEKYKDSSPFSRVFLDKEIFKLSELSGTDCKLLMFIILYSLHLNADFVILNPKIVSRELGIGTTTLYNSITSLVKNLVIAKKTDEDNIYWLNPYICFRGDRKRIKHRKI